MLPKVSIIMPCLNVVPYIKACIESVINQTVFDELEVIVIDAGSTDGTYELMKYYSSLYDNITVICSDQKSYGYQVNLGIKMATGRYVAILETDDYVRTDMYEVLYSKAESQDVEIDYIKAEFDSFYQRPNGTEVRWPDRMLYNNPDKYDHVLDPSRDLLLCSRDYSIWKGIYRRSFLIDNSVFLNESPGAAYQDIGFCQLLHAKARRAIYTQESLYRYRRWRIGASTSSGRGLLYSCNEFKRVISMSEEYGLYIQGLYTHLFTSFIGEFSLLEDSISINGNQDVSDSIRWFIDTIDDALSEKKINLDSFREDQINKYQSIKQDPYKTVKELISNRQKKTNELLQLKTEGCPRIIFGAGTYGKKALYEMDRLGISVNLFFDNGFEKLDTIGGIKVVSPSKSNLLQDAFYFVANRYRHDEMMQQLVDMGVSKDKIMLFG